jgi:hypothetical protein
LVHLVDLVCLVYLVCFVCLVESDQLDELNKPNKQNKLSRNDQQTIDGSNREINEARLTCIRSAGDLRHVSDVRGFHLMLLGTRAVESGGSIGKIKRNEQPLFRGESAGFANLLLCQHVAKFTGTSRSIWTERQGCGRRFRFHGIILHGNDMPVTTQEDACSRDAPS